MSKMFIKVFGVKNPKTIGLVNNMSDEKCEWFYMNDAVISSLKALPRGTEIEVETSEGNKGSKFINSFKQIGSAPASVHTGKPEEKKFYGKSLEEQATIKRQAIGHMVSRTIVGLQGSVDINNVLSVIDTLYKKYTEVVG